MKSDTQITTKAAKFVIKHKVIITAVTTGAIVGSYIDDSFERNRYPIHFEYQLISECIGQVYSSSKSQSRTDSCICALEKTMNDIEYEERASKPFSSTFKNYLKRCQQIGR